MAIITSDNCVTADASARRLGINKVEAGVLPQDKAAVVS